MLGSYDFFGLNDGGTLWNTPTYSDTLDEMRLGEGSYDEVLIDLDTDTHKNIDKPTLWTETTILNPKFENNISAGTINTADGFKVTDMFIYRTIEGKEDWEIVARFEYDENFNAYEYIDRYTQNGIKYRYAIAPVANDVIGGKVASPVVDSEFEGMFITDKFENKKLTYDVELGDINTTTSVNTLQPLNSRYPVVVTGNSNYKNGSITALPLSKETMGLYGSNVDQFAEHINRQEWLNFINNFKAKVIRMENGEIMLVATSNARETFKSGEIVGNLASIAFDYTEIGKLDFDTMVKNNLIANNVLKTMSYDGEDDEM